MKTHIKTLATLSALALATSVQAQNIIGSTSSTSAWLGTPVFQTGAAPTTDSGGTSQDNDNWGGNANGTAGYGALAEAFVVTQSGTLSTAEIVMAGSAATFNVELYNMGPAPANWPSATVGGPATITQYNNLGGTAGSFSPPSASGGLNLLQAGDQLTYYGAPGQILQTLTFTGADANVSLIAGDVYILSLDPIAQSDGTWWVRGAIPVAAYNTGEGLNADGVAGMQNFEGKTSSIRDFDTAITEVVPEPASMVLMGLGVLAILIRRRHTA
jgi:hypothetical protein